MRTHLAAAILVCMCARAFGDTTTKPADEDRLERLEQRLDAMERRHEAELKARDEQIAKLKDQLDAQKTAAATQFTDEIDKERTAALREIVAHDLQTPQRFPANFNPDLAVVTNFDGNYSPYHKNPALNRFDITSVELDLRAAVDPRADAVAILPISRDIENPLFFNPLDPGNGNVDTSIDIEEAYLFLHDFGVPNLTAQLGRYHLRFGRWNLLHEHDWPTVDNAFVVQSFLGPEALVDSGLSLSYVVPPKLTRNEYVEVIAQIISGEGDPADPVLNNNALIRSPGVNMHALWNHDITKNWNLEAGSSWLHGHHNNDNDLSADVVGGDFTLIHTDPTGRFNNQLFQSEVMYGDVNNGPWPTAAQFPNQEPGTQQASGGYFLGQQQLTRDWYVGARLDWTENAVNDGQEVWGISPYVSWYWSEFLRFRLEYQHKDGDVPAEDILYFQATWIFGAHPPHPYWVMR